MKLHEQMGLQHDINVPWEVWRFFGKEQSSVKLSGSDASFGEDFGDLGQLRTAVAWYVDQLGGKVKWEK